MKCEHCNEEMNEEDLLCPKCNKKTESLFESPIEEAEAASGFIMTDRMKKIGIAVLSCLLAINIISITAMIFSRQSNAGSSAEYQKNIDLGDKYLAETDYERAILAYESAIEIEENEVLAYEKLAEVYTEIGEDEKAEEIMELAEVRKKEETVTASNIKENAPVVKEASDNNAARGTASGDNENKTQNGASNKTTNAGNESPQVSTGGEIEKETAPPAADDAVPKETAPITAALDMEEETQLESPISETERSTSVEVFAAFLEEKKVADAYVEWDASDVEQLDTVTGDLEAAGGLVAAQIINRNADIGLLVSTISYADMMPSMSLELYKVEDDIVISPEQKIDIIPESSEEEAAVLSETRILQSENECGIYICSVTRNIVQNEEDCFEQQVQYIIYDISGDEYVKVAELTEVEYVMVKEAVIDDEEGNEEDNITDIKKEPEYVVYSLDGTIDETITVASCYEEVIKPMLESYSIDTRVFDEFYARVGDIDNTSLEDIQNNSIVSVTREMMEDEELEDGNTLIDSVLTDIAIEKDGQKTTVNIDYRSEIE